MGPSRFPAIGVAAVVLVALVLSPALIVVGFYAFANVYALVTGPGFSSASVNVAVLLTGLVLTVAGLLVAIAAGVGIVGRGLAPRRRGPDGPLEPGFEGSDEP